MFWYSVVLYAEHAASIFLALYWIQLDAEVMRVRRWLIYLGKLKGIAPNSTAGSFDTSHHVALGVRMSSRGIVFVGNFVKNLPSGWEVEMGTQHKINNYQNCRLCKRPGGHQDRF